MKVDALRVFNLPKGRLPFLKMEEREWSQTFQLETCQRWLWISNEQRLSHPPIYSSHVEIYRGKEAYSFLLRIASGLESKVIGETDIFGQFKEGWRVLEALNVSWVLELAPWIKRVFEDTKEIRTQYLRNLGGSSYGARVRKLIRDPGKKSNGPVFLVGAGKLAYSIAPYLLESEVWLWNRDSIRLGSFYQDLQEKPGVRIRKLQSYEEEAQGWANAKHVVVCIPMDAKRDEERLSWFKKGGFSERSVIHLGGLTENSEVWKDLPGFYSLSNLFTMHDSFGICRSVQISQAVKACEERAKLRSLGASLSIPHGWEDLACFV